MASSAGCGHEGAVRQRRNACRRTRHRREPAGSAALRDRRDLTCSTCASVLHILVDQHLDAPRRVRRPPNRHHQGAGSSWASRWRPPPPPARWRPTRRVRRARAARRQHTTLPLTTAGSTSKSTAAAAIGEQPTAPGPGRGRWRDPARTHRDQRAPGGAVERQNLEHGARELRGPRHGFAGLPSVADRRRLAFVATARGRSSRGGASFSRLRRASPASSVNGSNVWSCGVAITMVGKMTCSRHSGCELASTRRAPR